MMNGQDSVQIERVRLDNQWVTIFEVHLHLLISYGSSHGIIQDPLGVHEVCAMWVPKQLT
jgi:hypothetical protein